MNQFIKHTGDNDRYAIYEQDSRINLKNYLHNIF